MKRIDNILCKTILKAIKGKPLYQYEGKVEEGTVEFYVKPWKSYQFAPWSYAHLLGFTRDGKAVLLDVLVWMEIWHYWEHEAHQKHNVVITMHCDKLYGSGRGVPVWNRECVQIRKATLEDRKDFTIDK